MVNEKNTVEEASATTVLKVRGMHCASCVSRVENVLRKVPGVRQASVELTSEKATVKYDSTRVTADALSQAVAGAGYQASIA